MDAAEDMLVVTRELLESLVDGDDCYFDHHGGCQAHGYLSLRHGEKCPQAELKELLAAQAPEKKGKPQYDEQGNYEGLDINPYCEHRTVGSHRAWCFQCGEWCYPDALCARCELTRRDAK